MPRRGHPPEFHDGRLGDDVVAWIEAHLAGGCPACDRVLAGLDAGPDEVGDRVRQAARTPTACGSTPDPAGVPFQVDQYRCEKVLGRGGMGIVSLARDGGLGRAVAVKMTLGPLTGEAADRFRREAEAVARLDHPHIVVVHGTGTWQPPGAVPTPYVVFEYLTGGTLAGRWDRAPQPPREVAELVRKLADAVQHAHDAGVVHRDLKPANVLLAADGTPKVADFGLAKRLDAGADGPTLSGAVMGTPAYMAPEQADGGAVGPPADVHAWG